MRAAYLRVSSDKQDTNRQRESISAWAARNGAEILHWFEDSQGKNPRDQAHKRKGFQKLLQAVRSGLVDCVVVDSQDRFGTRDAYQWGQFITELRDHGCQLIEATSGRDLAADDDAAILTGTLGALTSTREQKEKAKRNLSGKLPKAKAGEYQGGYPAYGTDVVCFGPDGKEKWRTVYIGHHDRWKVYPDGRRERFKGKDNAPAKDPSDTLRYRPSLEKDRVHVVRSIFKWYATESISPRQVADRLNEMGVSPIFGEAWHKIAVRNLLQNPIYIGRPTWNKRAGSRFYEFVEGQMREVVRVGGKIKMARPRQASDFIAPDKPEFRPLISDRFWNRVQEKIRAARTGKKKRVGRTAELWLKPFLTCGRCDKPMRASGGVSNGRLWPSYFCGTYGTYGVNNPSGCHCHRVRHEVLERIVAVYLEEAAPQVQQLLAATDAGDMELARPLLEKLSDATAAYYGVACDMISFLEDQASARLLANHFKAGRSVEEVYGLLYEKIRPALEQEIEAKERELDAKLDQFRGLDERLKARANAKMAALQEEIQDSRQRLLDLRIPWESLRGELAARRDALERASEAIAHEGAYRQKSETLKGVISKIVCHFRHTKTNAQKNNGKSYLDSVEIVPASGNSVFFEPTAALRKDTSPGRG
jgi:DNA invertase Pin-like site-specific DNA recombinase